MQDICLSDTGLICLIWLSPFASIFFPHSKSSLFLLLKYFHYVCIYRHFSPILITKVRSVLYLLWTVPQWHWCASISLICWVILKGRAGLHYRSTFGFLRNHQTIPISIDINIISIIFPQTAYICILLLQFLVSICCCFLYYSFNILWVYCLHLCTCTHAVSYPW